MNYIKMLEDTGFEVTHGRHRMAAMLALNVTVKAIDQDGQPYRISRSDGALDIEPSSDGGDLATSIEIRRLS